MLKSIKPGNRYFIINCDEPYAKDIYEVLKKGQQAKGQWPEGDISFEEWYKQTFGFEIDDKAQRENECCGGSKHCTDRCFDMGMEDCRECFVDYGKALEAAQREQNDILVKIGKV